MKYFMASLLFLTVLTGCKYTALPTLHEACDVLREAGVTQNFRLTRAEVSALTVDHKVILNNIKQWFKANCQ